MQVITNNVSPEILSFVQSVLNQIQTRQGTTTNVINDTASDNKPSTSPSSQLPLLSPITSSPSFSNISKISQPTTNTYLVQPVQNNLIQPSQSEQQPIYTKQELYEYAVQLINEDRAKSGLGPVRLSNNQAAQTQANDMLRANQLSHWMSTGEKPYMSYTRFGGLGNVAQNVAGGPLYDKSECNMPDVLCPPFDPKDEIKTSEYQMMYNDADAKIPWGHRDNILGKYHTDVSIGIAYDQYSFYMVQNFENNYIEYTSAITENNSIVSFAGNLKSDSLYVIVVFYDPLPSTSLYQLHKNDGYYDQGDLLFTVRAPPQGNLYYAPSNSTYEIADNWGQQGNIADASFDLSPFVTKAGVYTVYVMLQDNEGNQFPVTSYSIIKNSPMVQDGFKSSKVYYACTSAQLSQYDQLQQKENSLNQQIDSLQKQIDNMKPQVQKIPQTVPQSEYVYDEQIISHYNSLVKQDDSLINIYNNLQNQLESFRC